MTYLEILRNGTVDQIIDVLYDLTKEAEWIPGVCSVCTKCSGNTDCRIAWRKWIHQEVTTHEPIHPGGMAGY